MGLYFLTNKKNKRLFYFLYICGNIKTIIMTVKNKLNHKIYLPNSLEHLLIGVLFGFLIFLELLMYQPWATYSYHASGKILLLSGYGVIAFVCYILFWGLPLLLIKEHWENNIWNIKKELLVLLFFIIVTSLLSAFYHAIYFNKSDYNLSQLHNWLQAGGQLGLFPLVLLFIWKLNKSKEVAIKSNDNKDKTIIIKGDNKKEQFELVEKSIVYVKSDKNYIELYFIKNNVLDKLLFRATMTKMEQQLSKTSFMRIHKSYMVNISLALKVYTVNSTYVLEMQAPEKLELPVSRTYLANVRKNIENNI